MYGAATDITGASYTALGLTLQIILSKYSLRVSSKAGVHCDSYVFFVCDRILN